MGAVAPATATGQFLYAAGKGAEPGSHANIHTFTIEAGTEACLTFDYSIFVSI